MTKLATKWIINGNGGFKVGSDDATQFLVLGIVLTVISLLLISIFAIYFARFKKLQYEAKIVDMQKIIWTFTIPSFSTIMGILLILFWSLPETLFGINGADALFGSYLGIAIPGFILAFLTIILMWIWIPKYGILFDENKINFVGDAIPYKKIINFIQDDETKKIYINYIVDKNRLKKQSYNVASMLGQFILANVSLTGKVVESSNEKDFINKFESTENFEEKSESTKESIEIEVNSENKDPQVKKARVKKVDKSNSIQKIGRKVPDPKPFVYVEPKEITINSYRIPKYNDQK